MEQSSKVLSPKILVPKILVIDDDPDVAQQVRDALSVEPVVADVIEARSTREGLARLAESPDLIILDIILSQGDEGFRFLWQLRNRCAPEHRCIPVLVLTSLHSRTLLRFYPDRKRVFDEGCPEEQLPVEGFLDKPASPTVLRASISRLLARE